MIIVKWLDDKGQIHETQIKADTTTQAELKVWNENDSCINIIYSRKD